MSPRNLTFKLNNKGNVVDPDGSSKIVKNPNEHSMHAVASAFLGNLALAILKTVAFFLTRSPSIFSEAVHSVVDTINQGLLFLGFKLSLSSTPSKRHPWGTHQIQYLFNFASALIIFFVGCLVPLFVSVNSLINPKPYSFTWHDQVGIAILVLALIIESYPLIKAIKAINAEKGEEMSFWQYLMVGRNMTIIAIFLEDLIAIMGVMMALGGQYISHVNQSSTADGIAGIFIAVTMGVVSGFLLLNNSKFLLGQSLPETEVQEILEFIEAMPEVEKVTKISTEVLSMDKVYLSIEVEFHGSMLVDPDALRADAERIRDGDNIFPVLMDVSDRMVRVIGSTINEIEKRIKAEYPKIHSIDLEIN